MASPTRHLAPGVLPEDGGAAAYLASAVPEGGPGALVRLPLGTLGAREELSDMRAPEGSVATSKVRQGRARNTASA
jgi:hypothetical protein